MKKAKFQHADHTPDVDFSVIRTAINVGGRTIDQILNCIHYGSEEVRHLLLQQSDFIVECKMCRNMFRSVPNFIAHKRVYCKELCHNRDTVLPSLTDDVTTVTTVVQPEAPSDIDSQSQTPESVSSSNSPQSSEKQSSKRPEGKKVVEAILEGSFQGNSKEYNFYTKAAEMVEVEKDKQVSSTLSYTPITSNPNAVRVSIETDAPEQQEEIPRGVNYIQEISDRSASLQRKHNPPRLAVPNEPKGKNSQKTSIEKQTSSEKQSSKGHEGKTMGGNILEGLFQVKSKENNFNTKASGSVEVQKDKQVSSTLCYTPVPSNPNAVRVSIETNAPKQQEEIPRGVNYIQEISNRSASLRRTHYSPRLAVSTETRGDNSQKTSVEKQTSSTADKGTLKQKQGENLQSGCGKGTGTGEDSNKGIQLKTRSVRLQNQVVTQQTDIAKPNYQQVAEQRHVQMSTSTSNSDKKEDEEVRGQETSEQEGHQPVSASNEATQRNLSNLCSLLVAQKKKALTKDSPRESYSIVLRKRNRKSITPKKNASTEDAVIQSEESQESESDSEIADVDDLESSEEDDITSEKQNIRQTPVLRSDKVFMEMGVIPYHEDNMTLPEEAYTIPTRDFHEKCLLCFRNFTKAVYLRIHVRTVHMEQLQCPKCPKLFVTLSLLRSHFQQTHSSSDSTLDNINVKSLIRKPTGLNVHFFNTKLTCYCFSCNSTFRKVKLLRNHYQKEESCWKKWKLCRHCGASFSSTAEHIKHVKCCQHHGSSDPVLLGDDDEDPDEDKIRQTHTRTGLSTEPESQETSLQSHITLSGNESCETHDSESSIASKDQNVPRSRTLLQHFFIGQAGHQTRSRSQSSSRSHNDNVRPLLSDKGTKSLTKVVAVKVQTSGSLELEDKANSRSPTMSSGTSPVKTTTIESLKVEGRKRQSPRERKNDSNSKSENVAASPTIAPSNSLQKENKTEKQYRTSMTNTDKGNQCIMIVTSDSNSDSDFSGFSAKDLELDNRIESDEDQGWEDCNDGDSSSNMADDGLSSGKPFRTQDVIWVEKKPAKPPVYKTKKTYVVSRNGSKKALCLDHKNLGKFMDVPKIRCTECNRRFSVLQNLKTHIIEQHLLWKRHECSVCGAQMYQLFRIIQHVETEHKELVTDSHPASSYVCNLNAAGNKRRDKRRMKTFRRNRANQFTSSGSRPQSSSKSQVKVTSLERNSKEDDSDITNRSKESPTTTTSCNQKRERSRRAIEEKNKTTFLPATRFNISTRNSTRNFDTSPYKNTLQTLVTRRSHYEKSPRNIFEEEFDADDEDDKVQPSLSVRRTTRHYHEGSEQQRPHGSPTTKSDGHKRSLQKDLAMCSVDGPVTKRHKGDHGDKMLTSK